MLSLLFQKEKKKKKGPKNCLGSPKSMFFPNYNTKTPIKWLWQDIHLSKIKEVKNLEMDMSRHKNLV